MGKVLCVIHGVTGGPHVCSHIDAALYGRQQLDPAVIVRFRCVYWEGDAGADYNICQDCAALCNFGEGDTVSLSAFDDDHPIAGWAPTCNQCLDAWLTKPEIRSGG